MTSPDATIAFNDCNAGALTADYEALEAVSVWAGLSDVMPVGRGLLALDVGAGSGRDAAWLARCGFEVVAAEPAAGMRREGTARHPDLRWVDDRLPELATIHGLGLAFDLVLLGAVWMHVTPPQRARAFRKLVTLLKPGGSLMITLRHGPSGDGRTMHPSPLGEVETLAREHGLALVRAVDSPDVGGRTDVSWTGVCLRLPDDGSIGLPMIRGVILNDDKSSTYKLALLRAVAKVADGASSLVRIPVDTSDRVSVPLGLVALNWIREYLPLVSAQLPQMPGNAGPEGLRFRQGWFQGARRVRGRGAGSAHRCDPRRRPRGSAACGLVGSAPHDRHYARALHEDAQRDDATFRSGALPARMGADPDHHHTGDALVVGKPVHARSALADDAAVRHLDRAGTRRRVGAADARVRATHGAHLAPGAVEARMVWLDPARDTAMARTAVERLSAAGRPVICVWSGIDLRSDGVDIDHALPWSAWPCNDLWNLMPSSRRVNQHEKRDKLPSASVLADARGRIIEWWSEAWRADPALAGRFASEARASLPIEGEVDPHAVFAGMEWRRLRLQQDQSPPLWAGAGSRQ